MTITLPPETEAKLFEAARREGLDADSLANALLEEALERKSREFSDNVASIQEGLNAVEAGKEKLLSQYIAEQRAGRGLPESWPSSNVISETAPGIVTDTE
jgi:predicted transcriptional regulator